jgi:ferrous iron transport protein A
MNTKKLGELQKGQRGVILKIQDSPISRRLLEMGLVEGCEVQLVHEAPISLDPIAVRARGAIIALRRNEANLIEVGDVK